MIGVWCCIPLMCQIYIYIHVTDYYKSNAYLYKPKRCNILTVI